MDNKEYYLRVLCFLRKAVPQKRTDLYGKKFWQLHQVNASALNSLLVREYLTKSTTAMISHHPY